MATPTGNPPVGFFTGRAALGLEGNNNIIPDTSPAFNPKRPTTIPRSAGIDHNKSSPIPRKVQATTAAPHNIARPNFENPSLNPHRMIGAPPGRGGFRAPGAAPGGIKRPADQYPSANHTNNNGRVSLGQVPAQRLNDNQSVNNNNNDQVKRPRT